MVQDIEIMTLGKFSGAIFVNSEMNFRFLCYIQQA